MTQQTRRSFVQVVAWAAAGMAGTRAALAADAAKVLESDPQAQALGYRDDTTKVDAAKYPKHTPAQHCANCQLYQGKATDAAGACALFGGKQVAAKGWCTAWVKKA
ncbi:MAG: high-potential iron-sulfur protein [Caldimonas sp.]